MTTSTLEAIAKNVRGLAIDGIEAANSGHPGLPLGCAELGAYLYAKALTHNPKNPNWINRDRFVLSAGHGSMLQYALLHLSGFELPIDQLKNFRQLHSACAGHPEYRECPGVEMTTGPLGQGIATAVGMALGNQMVAKQCGLEDLLNNQIYVLTGDGCMMEGVSSEASSLAGHWKLKNLTVIYDANDICLDGPVEECLTEDVAKRYEAYGWQVMTIDGHDFDAIEKGFAFAKASSEKPTLIIAKTTIGKGAPGVEGTSEVHGKPLGAALAKDCKEALGIPTEPSFYVDPEVRSFFDDKCQAQAQLEAKWQSDFDAWAQTNPEGYAKFIQLSQKQKPANLAQQLKSIDLPEGKATRALSSGVIQYVYEALPYVVGGSADLSCSDNTMMKAGGILSPQAFGERNIKYGPREFAMATIASGLVLQGMSQPFIGTFLTFSDYMRNAIRLAALMKLPVIYQFTHDSIYLGEDGPTHQPVEHVASLRAMPGLNVIRPADGEEVKGAWYSALTASGPTALILTRQGVKVGMNTQFEGVLKGAYILSDQLEKGQDICLIATGSELGLATEVASQLTQEGHGVRVVSMPCMELFLSQSASYQQEVLGQFKLTVSLEAGSSQGWHRFVGRDGITVSVDEFGLSAPADQVAKEFGFTAAQISERITKKLAPVQS